MAIEEYDVICVGAGFGSIATLVRLRKQGYNVKIIEKGPASGGIWYWNCYPGARVDSDAPIYQMFDKEVYQGFSFKERYPGWQELRRYFQYIEEVYHIKDHVKYNCCLEGATFDESRYQWDLKCSDGSQLRCKWFIPCIGFAAKKYVPPYQGIDKFKGVIEHTATWPQEGVDLKGKRIAVIGTGASGVQCIQECGRDAKQLTAYQRTPNFALPMNQRPIDEEENKKMKDDGRYEAAFLNCHQTFAGFDYDFQDRKTFDDTPEERKAFYHWLLVEEGGFRFWLNTYSDMLKDEKANMEAYNFWRDYVHTRVKNPVIAEKLAPKDPPHPWGTKRPSLEQYYYEIYNLPHVDLISLGEDPIEEITETGIKSKSGHREFDVIILATGFDSVTGSLAQLDIKGTTGKSIREHWADGLKTSMGIALHEFPNLFFLYGPQAPTAFSNGPSCVQIQARFLDSLFKMISEKKIDRIEATEDSEEVWTKRCHEEWDGTLFPRAKSWYQGANIPGRKVEPLNWAGGIPAYIKALNTSLENNMQGWIVHPELKRSQDTASAT